LRRSPHEEKAASPPRHSRHSHPRGIDLHAANDAERELCGLDIAQSEAVHAYSHTVFAEENQTPSVDNTVWLRGEERTEALIELLSQQRFRRSLRNLLPWEETGYAPKNNLLLDAIFSFSDRQDCLYFESYFGRLNLSSTTGNKLMLCTTSGQKEFLR